MSITGTGCTGKWQSHHCRRDFKDVKMWHLGTWLSGVLSSAILKGGLEDLRVFPNRVVSVIE